MASQSAIRRIRVGIRIFPCRGLAADATMYGNHNPLELAAGMNSYYGRNEWGMLVYKIQSYIMRVMSLKRKIQKQKELPVAIVQQVSGECEFRPRKKPTAEQIRQNLGIPPFCFPKAKLKTVQCGYYRYEFIVAPPSWRSLVYVCLPCSIHRIRSVLWLKERN